MSERSKGFTLLEVLVAVTLLGVGIFAVLGSMGALAKSERHRQTEEYMMRLARRRYDDNLATNTNLQSPTNGNFQDWNEPNYNWSTTVDTTSQPNLYAITLTVTPNGGSSMSEKVSGLVYIPPQTSSTP